MPLSARERHDIRRHHQLEKVGEIAAALGISRVYARELIMSNNCYCGSPAINLCWRMGGEAACAKLFPQSLSEVKRGY
jgi:hypothetical protein